MVSTIENVKSTIYLTLCPNLGISYLNSIERFDPHTNQWSGDVAPTSSCRTSVGVAVLETFLYAVGGQDGVGFTECYKKKI